LIGYYLYRFGDKELPFTKQELAETLGMGWNSMSLKIANFKAVDTGRGMDGFSNQCQRIYNRYNDVADEEFSVIGMEAILRLIEKQKQSLEKALQEKKQHK